MKGRNFSTEFKAKVAVEVIKGQCRANELAQEFGVHVNQINLWKKQLLEAAPKVFSRGKDREVKRLNHEREQTGQTRSALDIGRFRLTSASRRTRRSRAGDGVVDKDTESGVANCFNFSPLPRPSLPIMIGHPP